MGVSVFLLLKQYRNVVIILTTVVVLSPLVMSEYEESKTGFVALLMAIFWMTEALPLPVTSLLPVALFPFLGILDSAKTCAAYMKETNMMFFGGLVIALAIEQSNLHTRIALNVLKICGTNPKWLMLSFMFITMFLSMWISNTAATAMLVPIVDAVIKEFFQQEKSCNGQSIPLIVVSSAANTVEVKEQAPGNVKEEEEANEEEDGTANSGKMSDEDLYQMRKLMHVAVAYSASIGGTGTMIGSSPQLVLRGIAEESYPSMTDFSFATWMALNVPCVIVCIGISWIWLTFLGLKYFRKSERRKAGSVSGMIGRKCAELGSLTFQEIVVVLLFLIIIAAWFFKDPQFINGWASLIPYKVGDSAAVVLVILLLFVVPARPGFVPGEQGSKQTILSWNIVQQKFPWGLILLLGGGFAISDASKKSGLSKWLGLQLSNSGIHVLPNFALLLVVCCITGAITEVASNTAAATVILPVLSHLAESMKLNPLYLMIPASVACSFAFLLPAASPPNAIVFTTANMKTIDMVKTGVLVKVICTLVICVVVETLGGTVMDLHSFPSWAVRNTTKSI